MAFNTYFRASSYAMIAVAMLALVLAGGLNFALAASFALVMTLAWKLEGTKWQLSERTGLIVVLLALPVFYLDWKFLGPYLDLNFPETSGAREGPGVGALAHLILFLSAVKLLQVKADRDWVFLYLISFFEVLLAAGLSLSPVFLASFSLYLVCGLSTVIAFEIHKASRRQKLTETRLLVSPDSTIFKRLVKQGARARSVEAGRLPVVALGLLVLIFVLALPLFLVAPRAGSAAFTRGGAGVTNFIGFSESVLLGEIGALKQNNDVVMHVRIEDAAGGRSRDLKWRGVALDEFTGRGWRKSPEARGSETVTNERGFFQLGTTEALHRLTTQTVFLEPLDTPILFAAPRAVGLQGPFPYLRIDNEGSIQSRRHEFERVIYKAFSDTTEPDADVLRRDVRTFPQSFARYLQLPSSLDPRIADLARAMIANAHARNPYDAARAIETQLRTGYGYTLQMKAGGRDPLADFLFNVRAGHCEYFSTAMAVMLRTQNIAARVVNGFLPGEYNEAAHAFTVRQSDAHSWVEVYFPGANSWITFDPTPAAGRSEPVRTGLVAQLGRYAEAFELMWFQYVVGYDKQEQRSLATGLRKSVFDLGRSASVMLNWLKRLFPTLARSIVSGLLIVSVLLAGRILARRIRRLGWRRAVEIWKTNDDRERSAVDFYNRLILLLEQRGLARAPDQTPIEFAASAGLSEVLTITSAYNRVRFGADRLSADESKRIEELLIGLENRFRVYSV